MSRDFTVTPRGRDVAVTPRHDRAAAWLRRHAAECMCGFDRAILDRGTWEDLRDMALVEGLKL